MLGDRRAAAGAAGRARAASSGVVRDPGARRGTRRGDRRAPWLSARGRQRGRCGARRRDSASAVSADIPSRRAVCPRPRCCGADLKAYVLVGAIESEDFAMPGRAKLALGAADCVIALTPYAGAEQLADSSVHPADRRVCRDLGHLGQRRGTLAERCGRGASAGRSAARLEDPARARQPARRDGIRLPELRGRSRRAAAASWTGCTPAPPAAGAFVAGHLNGVDKVRATSHLPGRRRRAPFARRCRTTTGGSCRERHRMIDAFVTTVAGAARVAAHDR